VPIMIWHDLAHEYPARRTAIVKLIDKETHP
jgi:hypothetical protein